MEKDHNQQRENHHEFSRDILDLKEEMYRQKTNSSYFNKEIMELSNKFTTLEQIISQNKKEKNEEISTLQRHILRQQVEIEHILEKITNIATEIEELTIQVSGFKKDIKKNGTESVKSELSDVKNMLSDLIQLMGDVEKKSNIHSDPNKGNKKIVAKKNNNKLPSDKNNFLKLNQYMSDDQQSIVVSAVKKKKQNDGYFQAKNQYPLQYDQPKSIRIEASPRSSGNQQHKYVQSNEEDDQSPKKITVSIPTYKIKNKTAQENETPNTKVLDPKSGIKFHHFITNARTEGSNKANSVNEINLNGQEKKRERMIHGENEIATKRNVSSILLQSKEEETKVSAEEQSKRSWISLLNIFK